MSSDLAVVVIHGMGSPDRSFAQPMIDELKERIDDRDKDPDRVAWKPIYWADVLVQRQLDYLSAANRDNDLDYIRLRRFVVSALGDVTAYRRINKQATSTYDAIHDKVRQALAELYADELDPESPPLIVLAHSLGGHIMSNYIWDTQQAADADLAGLSPFEKMESLAGMVTFGCNIPLFLFAYAEDEIEPIEFPAAQLPDDVKAEAKWLNFFDPDDVLGYPLKSINDAYDAIVSADLPINAGSVFSSWNPLSHGGYWTDNDFTNPVADFLAELL